MKKQTTILAYVLLLIAIAVTVFICLLCVNDLHGIQQAMGKASKVQTVAACILILFTIAFRALKAWAYKQQVIR